MKASRAVSGPRYLTISVVVLSEALKFLASISIYTYQSSQRQHEQLKLAELNESRKVSVAVSRLTIVVEDLLGARSDFLLLLIPAALYTATNNLQFIAASKLDAAIYQITYQAELIMTAFFSVMIMRQKLSHLRWLSILILAAGISIVSLHDNDQYKHVPITTTPHVKPTTGTVRIPISKLDAMLHNEKLVGLLVVLASCIFSGLAGVLFEFVLKKRQRRPSVSASNNTDNADFGTAFHQDLWLRNAQMSFGALFFCTVGAAVWHGQGIRDDGFLFGFDRLAWSIVMLQTLIGLVVTTVIATSDNVLKGFATSFSVVLSSVISYLLHNARPSKNSMFGSMLIFVASHMYSLPDTSSEDVAVIEKRQTYDLENKDKSEADMKSNPDS